MWGGDEVGAKSEGDELGGIVADVDDEAAGVVGLRELVREVGHLNGGEFEVGDLGGKQAKCGTGQVVGVADVVL